MAPILANAEREPDDDRGAAIELILGDTVTGYLGWTGDADVWKLSVETLSDKNAIDVEVSAVEGLMLTVEIADGIGQPLTTECRRVWPCRDRCVASASWARGSWGPGSRGPPHWWLACRCDSAMPNCRGWARGFARPSGSSRNDSSGVD
jgi:hypothetical protein